MNSNRTNRDIIALDKWVTIMPCRKQFYLGDDEIPVSCEYSIADYMEAADGDMIVVLPATSRIPSQMVGHFILRRNIALKTKVVKFKVQRPLVLCDYSYQFAYISHRQFEIMGSSDTFIFSHQTGCDCGVNANRTDSIPELQSINTDKMKSLIESLDKSVSNTRLCNICKVPANYNQVLEHMIKIINSLTYDDVQIDRKSLRYFYILLLLFT